VSPLWRDQIRIVLSPRQVALVRYARGWTPRVAETCLVSCIPGRADDAPWRSALAALDAVLPQFGSHTADVVVVVSNHFVRYALVTHADQARSTAEEQALARHSFERTYGAAATRWAFCLNNNPGGDGSQIAGAVDQDLLTSLRSLLRPTRLRLRSIQPGLMTAFNQWRRDMGDSAWFALVEHGRLCLARFQHDRWQSLRSVRTGDDWFRDLSVQLDRGNLLSDLGATGSDSRIPVFVFAPGCAEPTPQQAEERAIRLLHRAPRPGEAEPADAAYAMALIG
jgi:hypothetical protein